MERINGRPHFGNFKSKLFFNFSFQLVKMPEFLYSHLGSCIPKYLSTLDKILDNKLLINQSLFEKYQGKKKERICHTFQSSNLMFSNSFKYQE